MLVDFNAEITDAFGKVQYEHEMTPSGRSVLVPVTDGDGKPVYLNEAGGAVVVNEAAAGIVSAAD